MAGLYVLMQCLIWFLNVAFFAMLLRVILGWFSMGEQTRLGALLFVLTEPLILPVRILCARLGLFKNIPFDMPFLITNLILTLVSLFLEGAMDSIL